jgi:putative endopeptidase
MQRRFFFVIALLAGCATAPVQTPKALIGEHGFAVTGMDRTVSACDDFYQFAVGGWRKANPLPATFPRFGRFEEVAERNRGILREILDTAPPSSQMGAFWAACMDEQAVEAQGIAPIATDLARIDAIDDRSGVVAEIRRMHQTGINPLFRFVAQNDFKNSDSVIAAILQGGLGLPDRDYYLRDDERFTRIRQEYLDHVTKMFELAGANPDDAYRVIDLETALAHASMPRVEQRDPERIYHPMSVAEMEAAAPDLEWRSYFSEIGLGDPPKINVAQPDFIREANRLLNELPLETWKAYLRWNLLDAATPALPAAFVNQDFAFRGRILSGQQELKPRWQRCVQIADQSIGGLLGQEYVKRAFTPEAKRKMNELIDNLVSALREGIPRLEWMAPQTQSAALAKLDAFKRRIGYPDVWRDYSTMHLTRDSYARNLTAARQWAFRRAVSRIGKPDDPNEWGFFTPATVNASYNPSRNFITFPAGILQPPFYDPNADDAYNYGGIGTVIGHEMTHGFDDQGAKFDAAGNLRDWWTEEDKKEFLARADCIAEQYSEFSVEPGLNIQGRLVTGEAIADLGGATLALRAYEKSLEGKERGLVDGFTPEQRFFLGFAQVWAENMALEEQRRRALTDPHAQGPFRVNGTVANMPEFARAWRCAGNPVRRCNIW